MTKYEYNGMILYDYPPDKGFIMEEKLSKNTIYLDKDKIPGLIEILQKITNSKKD